MGTYRGALKGAAKRIGVPFTEYMNRLESGEKWCTMCKKWHPLSAFNRDRTRGDGIKARCKVSQRSWPIGYRDPLKQKARNRLSYAVRRGRIPRANKVPCTDCGHIWKPGERRHEYDHYRGYDEQHWLDVQVVCTLCHADREKNRGRQKQD